MGAMGASQAVALDDGRHPRRRALAVDAGSLHVRVSRVLTGSLDGRAPADRIGERGVPHA